MNGFELLEEAQKLIAAGNGDAKLFVNHGASGVAEQASFHGDHINTVGEDTSHLDGDIIDEEEGTKIIFIHFG